MSTGKRDVWQEIHSREVYRIILSSGSAKPTFAYLVRELAKNIGIPAQEAATPNMAARHTIGMMIAKGEIAIDDNGRFHIA